MFIKKLTLTNFRAFTQAEFDFQPGLNLLVGVNGVGKSSALEALRVCLSVIFQNITKTKNRKESFADSDIKIGADYLQVSCDFNFLKIDHNLLIVKRKKGFVVNQTDNIREQVIDTPDQEVITPMIRIPNDFYKQWMQQPIGIFFSTKRSLITEKAISKTAAQGGQAEALSGSRDFNLKSFAEWFNAQERLAEEQPKILKYIGTLIHAVETFMPSFSNLRVNEVNGVLQFIIDKNGTPLSLHYLSDGEKGVLSIVLDIAKRLSQANPLSAEPLKEGKGIILIDELDLHLHPKWQRTIVDNLTRTFPNCQFIASTHSPQIIGEVRPEFITIIDNETYKPASSYGIDSSRVLEELLDTPSRNKEVENLLDQLYKDIDSEKLNEAKKRIAKLIVILGPNDPEIIRSNTLISFLEEDLPDETDK